MAMVIAGATGALLASEIKESRLQARLLSWLAGGMTHQLEPGPNEGIDFPEAGPHDRRHGYTIIPGLVKRVTTRGAEVRAQARWSTWMKLASGLGVSPVYHEKDRAGLRVLDRSGESMFDASPATRVYGDFQQIPTLVAASLLYIENRELLDERVPHRNPALEWQRLAYAAGMVGIRAVKPDQKVPGASTLATQMEKFRHSRGGRTRSATDKLRQMAAASLRAYLDGPETMAARQRILLQYLNSVPLGAAPGWGEVNGLADGLRAWFGADFATVNQRLAALTPGTAGAHVVTADQALAYRRVLALLVGLRRPALLSAGQREHLDRMVRKHLRLLAKAGIISDQLRDAAMPISPAFVKTAARVAMVAPDRKGAEAVRHELLRRLGLDSLYDLDRLDLKVHTSLDLEAQRAVSAALASLADPKIIAARKLNGRGALATGDPSRVKYSFALYERTAGANMVRVLTDTEPGPFSLNDGMKLELGSTAKLRTMVSYLELVAEAHGRFSRLDPAALAALELDREDALGDWVAKWTLANPGAPLTKLMDAALSRRWIASPNEAFYTGGGVHRFHNYRSADDGTVVTSRQAFHRSVNLPFVRMMREIVHHLTFRDGRSRAVLSDPRHEDRAAYLRRFADQEGRIYLSRFHARYRGLDANRALARMAARVPPLQQPLSSAFLTARPDATPVELGAFLRAHATLPPGAAQVKRLHAMFAPGKFNLHDRGYIAGLHPLELWTVAELQRAPGRSLSELQARSAGQRQAAYAWLRRSGRTRAQNNRIRQMLERDAFAQLHLRWQRLGYPFPSLVPSLGTSLGSSGDRPSALAELAGIISAGGVRLPMARLARMRFASGTPYDTVVDMKPGKGRRVLPPEVAAAARELMMGVVQQGTARWAQGALGGGSLTIGGKTGTGDNRRRRVDRAGRVITETVKDRTATFVFLAGDRWFGVVTAHVPGEAAAEYTFTSSLPVRLLRMLAPDMLPAFGPVRQAVAYNGGGR